MEAVVESKGINKKQGLAFAAAWLGWAFDGLDGLLYTLVALPFVGELLHKGPRDPETLSKAALIQAVFFVGWAIGGAVFGRIGDRIGRTKTLNLTILTYACFTGLSFFSGEWWHLLIFRFIAALGIGGEWAAGSALVTETLPKKYHHWASATLQSGYMVGMLVASFSLKYLSAYPPKWIFLVGVIPAFATIWIRKAVPEPEEWSSAAKQVKAPPVSELFKPAILPTTIKVLLMSTINLCGAWTFIYFTSQLVRTHPDNAGLSPAKLGELVAGVTTTYTIVNIFGNYFAAAIAKWLGYRKGLIVLLIISFVAFMAGFSSPRSFSETQIWISVLGFTALGIFGIFPLYFPPLFPTLVRTTGAGFCYNMGRLITAGMIFGTGLLHDARLAILYAGFLYVIAIPLAFTMPEVESSATS